MMMLMAVAWACEPEVCVEQARVARGDLRLAESAELFQTACEGGDPEGCAGAAFALKYGNGVEKDEERAFTEMTAACEAGSPSACVLAKAWDDRIEENLEPWYREQCEAGVGWACYELGKSVLDRDVGIGSAWLVQGCDLGVGAACTGLGGAYYSGEGLPKDDPKALELFAEGCTNGSITGCLYVELYGEEFREDRVTMLCDGGMEEGCETLGRKAGREGRFADALVWFERSCALDSAEGCVQAGSLLISGPDLEHDPVRGEQLLVEACEQDGQGCGLLAFHIDIGDLEGGRERALPLAVRGCEMEDGYACSLKAAMVYPVDPEEALRSADRGCELGFVDACGGALMQDPTLERAERACGLGDVSGCHIQGLMLLQEERFDEAFPLFDDACRDGLDSGCFRQGMLWLDSRYVGHDPSAGMDRLGQLCDADFADGCVMLGVLYIGGEPVEQDGLQATVYFMKGCDLGNAHGCNLAAISWRNGVGVPKNRRKARQYTKRACALGDEDSC